STQHKNESAKKEEFQGGDMISIGRVGAQIINLQLIAVYENKNDGSSSSTVAHLQSKLEQELSEKTKLMQLLEQLQNHQQEERHEPHTENSAQEKLIREQVRILEDSLKREQEERESLGKKMELEKQEVSNLRQEHHQLLKKLHTLESIMNNTNTRVNESEKRVVKDYNSLKLSEEGRLQIVQKRCVDSQD
ncbi:unnamed protein product, partial [Timema podura]|nr:unnamed protein product [Timema podura]